MFTRSRLRWYGGREASMEGRGVVLSTGGAWVERWCGHQKGYYD
jgi:hypothetical protein